METSSALFELASVSLACRDQDTLLKTFAARVGATLGARAVLVWTHAFDGSRPSMATHRRPGLPHALERTRRASRSAGRIRQRRTARRNLRIRRNSPRSALRKSPPTASSTSTMPAAPRVKSALFASLPGAQSAEGVVEVLNKRSRRIHRRRRAFPRRSQPPRRLPRSPTWTLSKANAKPSSPLWNASPRSTISAALLLPLSNSANCFPSSPAKFATSWAPAPASLAGGRRLPGSLPRQKIGEDPTIEDDARVSLTEGLLARNRPASQSQIGRRPLRRNPASQNASKPAGFRNSLLDGRTAPQIQRIPRRRRVGQQTRRLPSTKTICFFSRAISEQAAVALHNANLLESERKVHALDALLKISQEITSTLDLDHVLSTVVHQAASVVPFDRCVIGFFDRGRFVLGALSGETEVPKTREMSDLRPRLEWVADRKAPSPQISTKTAGAESGRRPRPNRPLPRRARRKWFLRAASARRSRHSRRARPAQQRRRFSHRQ